MHMIGYVEDEEHFFFNSKFKRVSRVLILKLHSQADTNVRATYGISSRAAGSMEKTLVMYVFARVKKSFQRLVAVKRQRISPKCVRLQASTGTAPAEKKTKSREKKNKEGKFSNILAIRLERTHRARIHVYAPNDFMLRNDVMRNLVSKKNTNCSFLSQIAFRDTSLPCT